MPHKATTDPLTDPKVEPCRRARLLRLVMSEVRTGEIAGQVGEDVRIAPGGMTLLSPYLPRIPLGNR